MGKQVKRLEECMMGMSNLVKTLWPHAKLHPFGSCISNFAMRNSDVDFCLVMPTWPDGTECDKSEVVERLSEYLEKAGMLKVTALPNARVPIVKLTEVSCFTASHFSSDGLVTCRSLLQSSPPATCPLLALPSSPACRTLAPASRLGILNAGVMPIGRHARWWRATCVSTICFRWPIPSCCEITLASIPASRSW